MRGIKPQQLAVSADARESPDVGERKKSGRRQRGRIGARQKREGERSERSERSERGPAKEATGSS